MRFLLAAAPFPLLCTLLTAQVAWTPTWSMAASQRDLLRFDPARQRLVAFDPRDLADAWEWTGTRWSRRTSAHTPPVTNIALAQAQIVADPVRGRLVAALGQAGTSTWSLWEWDGTDWTQPPATVPTGGLVFLAFDPTLNRVLAAVDTSTWSWDGLTWRYHGSAPTGLNELLQVAADTTRSRVVALGIDLTSALPSSTWEWDGMAWTRIAGAALPYLGGPLAFEPLRGRIVLEDFWGMWEWNGADWTRPSNLLPPPLTAGVYATGLAQLFYFGGVDGGGGRHADLSAWNGQRWVALSSGPVTPELEFTGMAYDPLRRSVVVSGGLHFDTWEWDVAQGRWSNRVIGTGPRSDPALAWYGSRAAVVRFGGQGNTLQGLLDEFSEWTPFGWSPIPTATLPRRRARAGLAFDAGRGQLVLFGGMGVNGRGAAVDLGDTWLFDGTDWREVFPVTSPGPRAPHGMSYDEARGRIVLCGGERGATQPGGAILDTWEWDGATWQQRIAGTWGAPTGFRPLLQYDAARERTVRVGGPNWSVDEWDGTAWLPRIPAPPATTPDSVWSAGHLVYASVERTMLLFSAESRVVWRYGPQFPARYASFGAPCAAAGQPAPHLGAAGNSLAWGGASFTTEVQGLGGAQAVLMLLGASRSSWFGAFPLPFDLTPAGLPGCMLRVRADLVAPATIAGSAARWNLPIPGDPALRGSAFHVQGILVDPGANAGGLLFTEGGTSTIGAR